MAIARSKGRLEDILAAIVARLIAQVTVSSVALDAGSCYHSVNPDSLPDGGAGSLIFVVSMMSGTFDEGMIDGGGNEQLTVAGGVSVRIHSPLKVDKQDRDEQSLMKADLGLMPAMRAVLNALSMWSPGMQSGDTDFGDAHGLTRDPLIPAGYAFGKNATNPPTTWGELSFKCNFDWDLAAPTP